MVFSNKDCILIEQLHRLKGYYAEKLVKEFREKKWQVHMILSLPSVQRDGNSLVFHPTHYS